MYVCIKLFYFAGIKKQLSNPKGLNYKWQKKTARKTTRKIKEKSR